MIGYNTIGTSEHAPIPGYQILIGRLFEADAYGAKFLVVTGRKPGPA